MNLQFFMRMNVVEIGTKEIQKKGVSYDECMMNRSVQNFLPILLVLFVFDF